MVSSIGSIISSHIGSTWNQKSNSVDKSEEANESTAEKMREANQQTDSGITTVSGTKHFISQRLDVRA